MKLSDDIKARLSALFFISTIEVLAFFCMPLVPRNDFYFAVAGAFNFLALVLLTSIRSTVLVVDLAKLTFMQLFIQFIGWVQYSMYFKPYLYNWGIHAIVTATYIRIFLIGDEDGNPASHPVWRLFRRSFIGRFSHTNEVHQ